MNTKALSRIDPTEMQIKQIVYQQKQKYKAEFDCFFFAIQICRGLNLRLLPPQQWNKIQRGAHAHVLCMHTEMAYYLLNLPEVSTMAEGWSCMQSFSGTLISGSGDKWLSEKYQPITIPLFTFRQGTSGVRNPLASFCPLGYMEFSESKGLNSKQAHSSLNSQVHSSYFQLFPDATLVK